MKPELQQRLARLHVDMEPEVAERQLARVAEELRVPPAPVRRRRAHRVRLISVVAVAVLLLLPTAAVAAEGTVPGDFLYPVKRATEWVRSIVDPTIDAEHRIEELETVVDRGASIDEVSDRLLDAETAVEDPSVSGDLRHRLEIVRDRIAVDYATDGDGQTDRRRDTESHDGADVPASVPVPTPTTNPSETDRPSPTIAPTTTTATTTTPTPDTDRRTDSTTSTTAPVRDGGDRPPRDDRVGDG